MTEEKTPFAADAKRFLTQRRFGFLATISASNEGFPFGSIVPYDLTPDGRFVIYISLIAEHYKNLKLDNRSSVTVADMSDASDPQANARATALLRFERVSDREFETVKRSYEAKFPNTIAYEIAHNFLFMVARPERIRWIAGFGQMGWIDGTEMNS